MADVQVHVRVKNLQREALPGVKITVRPEVEASYVVTNSNIVSFPVTLYTDIHGEAIATLPPSTELSPTSRYVFTVHNDFQQLLYYATVGNVNDPQPAEQNLWEIADRDASLVATLPTGFIVPTMIKADDHPEAGEVLAYDGAVFRWEPKGGSAPVLFGGVPHQSTAAAGTPGTSTSSARGDHRHEGLSGDDIVTRLSGQVGQARLSATHIKDIDQADGIPQPATDNPTTITTDSQTAAVGTSAEYAREDHQHPHVEFGVLTDDSVLDVAQETRTASDRGKLLSVSRTDENDLVLHDYGADTTHHAVRVAWGNTSIFLPNRFTGSGVVVGHTGQAVIIPSFSGQDNAWLGVWVAVDTAARVDQITIAGVNELGTSGYFDNDSVAMTVNGTAGRVWLTDAESVAALSDNPLRVFLTAETLTENIDTRIDKALGSHIHDEDAHHEPGQSATQVDAKIAAHTADSDAHHTPGQTAAQVTAAIATHAADDDAHHTPGTAVAANPTGTDGDPLTRVSIGGTNFNLAGGLSETQVDARVQAAKGTTTPGNTPGTASAGTASTWSPSDHDHGITPGSGGPQQSVSGNRVRVGNFSGTMTNSTPQVMNLTEDIEANSLYQVEIQDGNGPFNPSPFIPGELFRDQSTTSAAPTNLDTMVMSWLSTRFGAASLALATGPVSRWNILKGDGNDQLYVTNVNAADGGALTIEVWKYPRVGIKGDKGDPGSGAQREFGSDAGEIDPVAEGNSTAVWPFSKLETGASQSTAAVRMGWDNDLSLNAANVVTGVTGSNLTIPQAPTGADQIWVAVRIDNASDVQQIDVGGYNNLNSSGYFDGAGVEVTFNSETWFRFTTRVLDSLERTLLPDRLVNVRIKPDSLDEHIDRRADDQVERLRREAPLIETITLSDAAFKTVNSAGTEVDLTWPTGLARTSALTQEVTARTAAVAAEATAREAADTALGTRIDNIVVPPSTDESLLELIASTYPRDITFTLGARIPGGSDPGYNAGTHALNAAGTFSETGIPTDIVSIYRITEAVVEQGIQMQNRLIVGVDEGEGSRRYEGERIRWAGQIVQLNYHDRNVLSGGNHYNEYRSSVPVTTLAAAGQAIAFNIEDVQAEAREAIPYPRWVWHHVTATVNEHTSNDAFTAATASTTIVPTQHAVAEFVGSSAGSGSIEWQYVFYESGQTARFADISERSNAALVGSAAVRVHRLRFNTTPGERRFTNTGTLVFRTGAQAASLSMDTVAGETSSQFPDNHLFHLQAGEYQIEATIFSTLDVRSVLRVREAMQNSDDLELAANASKQTGPGEGLLQNSLSAANLQGWITVPSAGGDYYVMFGQGGNNTNVKLTYYMTITKYRS